jgi:hypothetical protein
MFSSNINNLYTPGRNSMWKAVLSVNAVCGTDKRLINKGA